MVKTIFMIAGPNGAGKTTTAMTLLPDLVKVNDFINADEIARGLAPLNPDSVSLTASKLMIKRVRELLSLNRNFAFETTGAGTNYVRYLREAKKQGYEINLLFLWLFSPDLAIKRVAERVVQGGHDIPAVTIRRRYYAGLRNLLKFYIHLADSVCILDNSSAQSERVIVRKTVNGQLEIEDPKIWEEIQKMAQMEELWQKS
jgi:predicted ABC-type ATPase